MCIIRKITKPSDQICGPYKNSIRFQYMKKQLQRIWINVRKIFYSPLSWLGKRATCLSPHKTKALMIILKCLLNLIHSPKSLLPRQQTRPGTAPSLSSTPNRSSPFDRSSKAHLQLHYSRMCKNPICPFEFHQREKGRACE